MRRIVTTFFLLMLATVAQAREPAITIAVYNRARVAPDSLSQAEKIAQRTLQDAGVESVWINCRVSDTEGDDCRHASDDKWLVLTIMHSSHGGGTSEIMGKALEDESGNGSYCYIFRDKVDEIVQKTHLNPARLLGPALAHELGHLLLGVNSHSPEGIMAGRWNAREIDAARRGALGFTKHDAEAIQRRWRPGT